MLTPGPVAVARDVNAGLLAAYAAFESLDGVAPDFGAAATSLTDAQDALDDAQLGLAALPESKDNKRATKNVAKAQKGLVKVQDQVTDQNADKALKSLLKIGRSLVEAALLLNPQPFP
jgi:predicted outer membrane protein